jgi:hypothetical protein
MCFFQEEKEMRRKRECIANEILQTEEVYVKRLESILR